MAGSGSTGSGSGSGDAGYQGGDYSQLHWKDVMRYVTGEDPDHPENDSNKTLISDPQTLQDAADTFWYTQTLLQEAAKNLSAQTEALTGPNGPWQGPAAQALGTTMTSLSKQVSDMADALSGGITGDDNVPQQLADNAQHLRDATNKLYDIDYWYAQQALSIDPGIVMSNGQVAVSQVPKVVDMMNSDMVQVLVTLAGHYTVTTGSVTPPPTPQNPVARSADPGVGDPVGSGNPYGIPAPAPYPYTGPATDGSLPPFDQSGPGSALPYPGGDAGGAGGNLPPFDQSGPGSALPYPGGDAGGAGGNLPNLAGANVAMPAQYPGGGAGAGGGLPGFGGAGSGGTGAGLPLLSPAPQAYPGNASLSTGGNLPGNGSLAPNLNAALNPLGAGSTAGLQSPAAYPGLPLGPGTDNSTGSGNSGKSAAQYPGSTGVAGTGSLNSPGGLGDSSVSPGLTGASPAGLPGLNTSGTAAPNLGTQLQSYPGSALSAQPGSGTAGSTGTTGSSMPMMPMGGMGAGGAGTASSDVPPSDASGLLQGSAKPWQGNTSPGGSGHLPAGTAAGGPGLNLPGMQSALPGGQSSPSGRLGLDGMGAGTAQSAQDSGQSASGTPMMPMGGMGGMGAGSGTGAGERPASDASGLLEGSREPWAVTPGQHGADTGSSPGAQPGAGHLWLAGQNDGAGTGRTDGMGGEGISGSPSAVSPAGAPFGTAGAQDTGSSGGKASSGLLDGLPFLAAGTWAAAASGRSEEGTQGRRAESGAGHPGAAWTSADNAGLAAPAAAGAGAAPVAGTAPQEPAGASKAAGQVASEAVGSTDVATQAVSAAAPGTPQAQAPDTPEPTPEPGQDAAGQASGTAVHAAEGTVQEAVGTVTPMRPVVVPVAAPVPGPVQESAARVSAQTPVNGSARRPARASASEALTAGATSTAPGISTTDATSATDAAARWVVPVTVSGGPAADDMSAWDAPDSSLRHLLGGPAAGAAAADGTVAATTDQEAAAVIGVAGAAYAVGRLTGANEAQTFEEPVRPAWKPKAPGSGAPRRMEFTCATGPGDPPAAKKPDESEAPGTQSKGRTRRKDKEDDESTSVGDLLRQSEEIWGAGTRRTGSRG